MLKEKADIRSGENLSIHSSTIQGKDVDLEAGKDIRLTAAENRSEMDIHEKTKNGGISTSWGIGGLSGVKVYGQSAKGMENAVKLGAMRHQLLTMDIMPMRIIRKLRIFIMHCRRMPGILYLCLSR